MQREFTKTKYDFNKSLNPKMVPSPDHENLTPQNTDSKIQDSQPQPDQSLEADQNKIGELYPIKRKIARVRKFKHYRSLEKYRRYYCRVGNCSARQGVAAIGDGPYLQEADLDVKDAQEPDNSGTEPVFAYDVSYDDRG
ncbi:hypothetical protein G9A89_001653 [Geosiphon pyriformis]|nr:hypothetical protein G9A89_001653 [Geosiphon pyriformis]